VFCNLFSKIVSVYEIMWKNIAERGRPQMPIWRIACWIPNVTNAHTQVMQYSWLFHSNNGCTNASFNCIICTLTVLLIKISLLTKGNAVIGQRTLLTF